MSRKDMARAVEACKERGLIYDPHHKHPRVTDPKTGKFVSFSATPTCQYAHRHFLRDVRRYLGIEVPLK